MARLPGWLVHEGWGTDAEDRPTWILRVRRWHPGYWLALVRYLLTGRC